jgi:anti-sigma B factor antagonist
VSESTEGTLRIEVHDNVVALRGDVDMDTVTELAKTLEQLEKTVVVDVEGVSFIDSTGLQTLLRAHHAAGERGEQLILRRPSPAVSRVLDVTNMWGTFTVER